LTLSGCGWAFACSADALQRGDGGFVFVGFAAMAEHGRRQRQHAQGGAGHEEAKQHQDQRSAQLIVQEKVQVDFLRIFQGKAEKQDEKNESNEGGDKFHQPGSCT
jgi:hypothetical protein